MLHRYPREGEEEGSGLDQRQSLRNACAPFSVLFLIAHETAFLQFLRRLDRYSKSEFRVKFPRKESIRVPGLPG